MAAESGASAAPRRMRVNAGTVVLFGGIAMWGAVIAGGMVLLASYKLTPGHGSEAGPGWPAQTRISPPTGWKLLVFAHPFCPCTRATLSELSRLTARLPGRLAVDVIFLGKDLDLADVEGSTLYARAREMNAVAVSIDHDGREAKLFDAHTSGQALLYDPSGRLRFRGGLTASRGHEGDNDGVRRIAALVRGDLGSADESPVFGCSLDDPGNSGEVGR